MDDPPTIAASEAVDAGLVLAKAARRTGRWLGLTPEEFQGITGLAWIGDSAPQFDSGPWTRCLALVRLGGRLEAKLGRRGVVRAWLHGRHAELRPTPLSVLVRASDPAAVNDYLDAYER